MAAMSRQAREILRRTHVDRLTDAARQRLETALSENVALGQEPLADNELDPVQLPSTSLWTRLRRVASSRWGLAGFSALALGAVIGGARLRTPTTLPPPAADPATHQALASSSRHPPLAAAGLPEPAPTSRVQGPSLPAEPHSRRTSQRSQRSQRAAARAPSHVRATAQSGVSRATPSPATALPDQHTTAVRPLAAPASAPLVSTLDAELALLRRAHSELNAGRFSHALTQLAEHEQRFPAGQLAQMRDVAYMLALCGLGRESAAHTRAQRFLVEHPASPFIGQVRGVCNASTRMALPQSPTHTVR